MQPSSTSQLLTRRPLKPRVSSSTNSSPNQHRLCGSPTSVAMARSVGLSLQTVISLKMSCLLWTQRIISRVRNRNYNGPYSNQLQFLPSGCAHQMEGRCSRLIATIQFNSSSHRRALTPLGLDKHSRSQSWELLLAAYQATSCFQRDQLPAGGVRRVWKNRS